MYFECHLDKNVKKYSFSPFLFPSYVVLFSGRIVEYLQRVHDYMTTLTYNHTGTQFFETKPNSSMITLMETAKCMIREAIPIKCMEAVVLSIYLTNGVPCLGKISHLILN